MHKCQKPTILLNGLGPSMRVFCQGTNSGVLPPDSSYGGRSYQEWHALYVDQKLLPMYVLPRAIELDWSEYSARQQGTPIQ
jgi:hypothetical protein